MVFLPFSLAILTKSWYGLKDLFTLYRLADKVVLDLSLKLTTSQVVEVMLLFFFPTLNGTCMLQHKRSLFILNIYHEHFVCRHEGPVWQVSWAHPMFGNLLASCSYDRKVSLILDNNNDNNNNNNFIRSTNVLPQGGSSPTNALTTV